MSDLLDDVATIPQFEDAPKELLVMEPCMSMHTYMMPTSNPHTYVEVVGHPEWEEVMDEEYNSLIEN